MLGIQCNTHAQVLRVQEVRRASAEAPALQGPARAPPLESVKSRRRASVAPGMERMLGKMLGAGEGPKLSSALRAHSLWPADGEPLVRVCGAVCESTRLIRWLAESRGWYVLTAGEACRSYGHAAF